MNLFSTASSDGDEGNLERVGALLFLSGFSSALV